MALTMGTAPFSSEPAGEFDKLRRPEDSLLYWEPWPKRFRVLHDGKLLCDTRGAHALHETDHLMRIYVPREDVAMEHLAVSDKLTHCPWKGEASYWNVGTAENAVWAYGDPIESASFLADYMSFDLEKLDRWMMEGDEGYSHPRDPYHRYDVHKSDRHVIVRAADETIAESERPFILFETGLPPRYYIPRADVSAALVESEMITHCPYKGPAQHWHLDAGDARIENAGWSLCDPIGEAGRVGDALCFYPRKLAVEVDGERLGA